MLATDSSAGIAKGHKRGAVSIHEVGTISLLDKRTDGDTARR